MNEDIQRLTPPTVAPPGQSMTVSPAWWQSPRLHYALAAVAGVLVVVWAVAWLGGYSYRPTSGIEPMVPATDATKGNLTAMERKFAALQPRGTYIVVDSTRNRLQLMRHDEVLVDALASVGTGAVLIDEKSGRKWVFETPRGVRRVLSKKQHPCWHRPDWDFVENGEPLPTNAADRVDCAALGDYALYLGNGYMIHGTLYERSLGLSVTHGCVRLGAANLEKVFKSTAVGTKVYLF